MAKKKNILKEELTTKMHSEFRVSKIEDEKNRCMSVLTLLAGNISDMDRLNEVCSLYDVDEEDVTSFQPEYEALLK